MEMLLLNGIKWAAGGKDEKKLNEKIERMEKAEIEAKVDADLAKMKEDKKKAKRERRRDACGVDKEYEREGFSSEDCITRSSDENVGKGEDEDAGEYFEPGPARVRPRSSRSPSRERRKRSPRRLIYDDDDSYDADEYDDDGEEYDDEYYEREYRPGNRSGHRRE